MATGNIKAWVEKFEAVETMEEACQALKELREPAIFYHGTDER